MLHHWWLYSYLDMFTFSQSTHFLPIQKQTEKKEKHKNNNYHRLKVFEDEQRFLNRNSFQWSSNFKVVLRTKIRDLFERGSRAVAFDRLLQGPLRAAVASFVAAVRNKTLIELSSI